MQAGSGRTTFLDIHGFPKIETLLVSEYPELDIAGTGFLGKEKPSIKRADDSLQRRNCCYRDINSLPSEL